MKLIIGLGNVGEKYKSTRHNTGFLVLDRLIYDLGFKNYELQKNLKTYILIHKSCVLAKPTTMMNNSGDAVQKLVSFYHIKTSDLWVIHDDLDIKLGQYKIQFGVGPKVHNGLNSICEKLGNDKFWHVRVGVDNRNLENRISGEAYVLQKFTEEEEEMMEKTAFEIAGKLSAKVR